MGCKNGTPENNNNEQKQSEIPEFKILVIGDSAVGKTAIIHQYLSSKHNRTYTPTSGV